MKYPKQKELKKIFDYNPDSGIFVRKKNGKIAGSKTEKGVSISIKHAIYRASRLAWIYMHGSIEKGMLVHHINNDCLDCSIKNLKLIKPNLRRYLGGKKPANIKIFMRGDKKIFYAHIRKNKKTEGKFFDNEEEAKKYVEKLRIKYNLNTENQS